MDIFPEDLNVSVITFTLNKYFFLLIDIFKY